MKPKEYTSKLPQPVECSVTSSAPGTPDVICASNALQQAYAMKHYLIIDTTNGIHIYNMHLFYMCICREARDVYWGAYRFQMYECVQHML